MSRNSEKPTTTIKQFSGLATANDEMEYGATGLSRAINVDITRSQKVRRRKGATQLLAVPGILAAWANRHTLLYTAGTDLVLVYGDMSTKVLRNDLTPTRKLCAKTMRGRTYYSNGVQTGVLHNGESKALGIEHAPKPLLTEHPVGEMAAGRYLVVLTYVRDDGLESGCGVASSIILDNDNRGISAKAEPSDNPDVVTINMYVSRPNGTGMYLATTLANSDAATQNIVYRSHPNFLGHRLRTQFLTPPPPFNAIEEHEGRMLYGVGSDIIASEPFAPEHVMEGESHLPFNSTVSMIASGPDDGVFVGTEHTTYFLAGTTLESLDKETATNYGALPGSVTYIDAALLGDGSESGILPVWMSTQGLCVGMSEGSVVNLTQRFVDIPKGVRGASMFRQEDGQNHIISVIQK